VNCAACGHSLTQFMDFGKMALAGAFIRPDQFPDEQRYSLRLGFCESCHSVQVADSVPADTLFRNYFYFASATGTASAHFRAYAEEVVSRFRPGRVLEIGCNDGAMLRHLKRHGCKVIGVDPAVNVVESLDDLVVINDYFTMDVARHIGEVDMVVANNVFAHIRDINGVTAAVREVLADDGVFSFEVHYLGDMVRDCQYDAVYHEHVFYHSLIALDRLLDRHGMMVFDVKPLKVHGGSMRFYACKQGTRSPMPQVQALRYLEQAQGLDRLETFVRFGVRAYDHRRSLMEVMHRLKRERQSVAGYGASGRANTMLQFCGIDSLEYVIDDAQAKQGFCTPGSHFPIVPRAILNTDAPDYLLVLAWTYFDEIAPRVFPYRSHLIVPMPEVSIRAHYAPERMIA
jgi:methylation protein EvaC